VEVGEAASRSSMGSARSDDADRFPDFLRDDANRFDEISVIGDDISYVKKIDECVADEMNTKVHVTAFFLSLLD